MKNYVYRTAVVRHQAKCVVCGTSIPVGTWCTLAVCGDETVRMHDECKNVFRTQNGEIKSNFLDVIDSTMVGRKIR